MNMQINSDKIKSIRDQKCWSQQQLADMAGISLRTLQRVESKSVASQETIKSLASVLEIDCSELLPKEENRIPAQNGQTDFSTELGNDKKRKRNQLLLSSILIISTSLFALFTVFTAFEEKRIDAEQFQFFKGLVSVGLLVSVGAIIYRARKLGLLTWSDFS